MAQADHTVAFGLPLTAMLSAAEPPRRPNVIVFLVDDMGWMDCGAYGSKYYETPNIDRFATRAMRFTDAYAQPLCSPTRASLLTGKYHRGSLAAATHRHRVDNPICGDSVQIELRVTEAGIIEQAWFTGVGCIISQAAASMLTEHIEGQPLDAIRTFGARNMLDLFRARLTSRRRQCCLLAWQALITAIEPVDQ